MTTTTRPPTTRSRRRTAFIGLGALSLGALGVTDLQRHHLLPGRPGITTHVSCGVSGGTIRVDLHHMPGDRADVTLWSTSGPRWAAGDNPPVHRGEGSFSATGAPNALVRIQVTPTGRHELVQDVAVDCGRPA